MTQRRLTLLVPALATPPNAIEPHSVEVAPAPGALQVLLSRSAVRTTPSSGMEAQLFHLFGIAFPDGDLPVAAVTYVLDCGENVPGWRMRCDPVHLVPGHNSLILAANDELEILHEESSAITGELNNFYSDKGWFFEAPTPSRWYLTLPQPPSCLQTHPLPDVLGRSIDRYLPYGEDAGGWHTTLAEVQMLLHGSQVNLQRESCGKPVINSLWFWGGGMLPEIKNLRWSRVWSNEVVGGSLAAMTNTPRMPVPESAARWLEQANPGEHLLVLDSGRYIPRFEERFTWMELLELLDRNWFAPLLTAMKKGELESLEIYAGNNRVFYATRRLLWRWWRRRGDISTLLGG